ncbi:hypothetical protein H0H93_009826 [Arthromyces matolae]|nr:hypothetical protein H0H93_009826 [Arthromyces matolae]
MPNFALFITIACVLYAGNASAGPVPRTNALLPQASNAFPSSASTFRAPDPINPSILQIDSLDRRDLILRRDDSRSIPELKKHVEEQETMAFGPYYRYTETELQLTHDFLNSHVLYGLGPFSELVQPFIDKAKQLKQRDANKSPMYLQKPIETARKLLDLYQDLPSLKKTTHASATSDAKAVVDGDVEVYRNAISSNLSKWQAEEAKLQSSIVEMLNGMVNLLKLLDESVGRGNQSYLKERKIADSFAPYAESVCKQNDRLPKAAEAAKNFLQFLAQTDKEANGTKRKAPEGDHEDVPTHGQKRTIM